MAGGKYDIGGAGYTAPTTQVAADTFVQQQQADTSNAQLVQQLAGHAINTYVGYEQSKLENKLTTIVSAREQGTISASEASVRARTAVKEATARLPGLGEDFRKQAGSYFSEFGPGGGALDMTAAETQQAKLALQEATYLQKEALDAQNMNMSVPEYRARQRLQSDKQAIENEISLRGITSGFEFDRAFNTFSQDAEATLLGMARDAYTATGGRGVDADTSALMLQTLGQQRAAMDKLVREADVSDPTQRTAFEERVKNWYDQQKELLSDKNIGLYLETASTNLSLEHKLFLQKEMGAITAIRDTLGDEGVKYAITMLDDPKKLEQLKAIGGGGMADLITRSGAGRTIADIQKVIYGTADINDLPVVARPAVGAVAHQTLTDPNAPDSVKEAVARYQVGDVRNPYNLQGFYNPKGQTYVRNNIETLGPVLDEGIKVKQALLKNDLQKLFGDNIQTRLSGVTLEIANDNTVEVRGTSGVPRDKLASMSVLLSAVNSYPERYLDKYNGDINQYARKELGISDNNDIALLGFVVEANAIREGTSANKLTAQHLAGMRRARQAADEYIKAYRTGTDQHLDITTLRLAKFSGELDEKELSNITSLLSTLEGQTSVPTTTVDDPLGLLK